MQRIYWADLHNHNEIGYGKGSLDRTYRLAKNSLDILAFSPHGYWPDPPATDPKMTAYHTEAFGRIQAQFPEVIAKANAEYTAGEFVAFIAYEWHTVGWGDYVVLFPGDTGELYHAKDLDDLQAFARQKDALLIPHHVAYRHGWRGLDWWTVDSGLSPLVEVFSEHGNSMERDGLEPMLRHSMGGVTDSQTVTAQLRRRRHIGFTAGTDNHHGYPACYGEGITGICAEALTRESVFEALRARHTLAATGDRIAVDVRSGGAVMGDRRPSGAKRAFDIQVEPLGEIAFVQIIKNGRPVQTWAPEPPEEASTNGPFLVHLDWGWSRMDDPELTEWTIDVSVNNGTVERVTPRFCGGAGSTELVNEYVRGEGGASVAITSFTSRANARPINGCVLKIAGDLSTALRCAVSSKTAGERGACALNVTLDDLRRDDAWAAVLPRFSSPRIRLGRAQPTADLNFAASWRDPKPDARDLYVVKVQQTNGHIAWTSPILFSDE